MVFIKKFKNFKILFCVFFLTFIYFFILQGVSNNFGDPDSFYHAKIALFLSEGKNFKKFPYLQQTILLENYTDHHFLYHIFLIPFIKIFSPLWGVKIFSIFSASIFITVFYFLLNKILPKKGGWLIILLIFFPLFLFRINLAKANSLALLFFLLFLWFLLENKKTLIFILSWLYVYLHGSFVLLPFVIIVKIFFDIIFYFLKNKKEKIYKSFEYNLKFLFLVFLGIVLGIILNPFFPKNLYFYWEQIYKISILNLGEKILVGGEWYPLGFDIFTPIILLLFFISIEFLLLKYKLFSKNTFFFAFLSFIFLVLTVLKSKRFIEIFVPLFIIFLSLFFLDLINKKKIKINKIRNVLFEQNKKKFLIFILFIFLLFLSQNFKIYRSLNSFRFDFLKNSSLFLKENTKKGDIVFHTDWDDFPILFFYNSHNYYLVGLDPTFMYDYNKDKYWLWYYIVNGFVPKNLDKIIKKEFNTNWVWVNKYYHKEFYQYLILNNNFKKVYEDNEAAIFKIID